MRTKKALYGIITSLLLQLVVIAYGFIVPKIIITNYGSDINGLLTSITQFLNYISLVEAGFGGVVIYLLFKPIAKKDRASISSILATSQKFFNKVSAVFVAYIILLCFIYPLIINSNFDHLFTASLILITSISIFSEYYFGLVYKIYLLADQKKYMVNIFSIITYLLNIIAIVSLSKLGVSVHILKLASALLFTIRPILQNVYVKRKYKLDIKKEENKHYEIKQKWDALAQHIAAVIHGNADVVILTLFHDISEVSVYSVYYLVTSGIHKLVFIFYDSLSSGFGDMIAKKDNKRLCTVFNSTESFYYIAISIIFSCTIVLITPFVGIYTSGVTDADYIRPLFGYLITIAQLWHCIRFPYSSIALAAGHYKETRKGAVAECLINVVTSLVLVFKFGIIGVAIGTIIAMLVRTCEFVYHSNKYVIGRSYWHSVKKICLLIIEITVSVILINLLGLANPGNISEWIVNALGAFFISSLMTAVFNAIFCKNDLKGIASIIKGIIERKKGEK